MKRTAKRLAAALAALTLVFVLPLQALAAETPFADALWGDADREGWADPWEQARGEMKQRFGGTLRAVDVMVNGQCLRFGEIGPVNRDGTVLAPARTLLESLGLDEIIFDGESKTMTASGDGVTIRQQAGTDVMTVTRNGETETVQPSTASLIGGDTLLVPVRDVAEALGYAVEWDQAYETAVLTDVQALLESIDSCFTLVNDLLGSLFPEPGSGSVEQMTYSFASQEMDEEGYTEGTLTYACTSAAGSVARTLADDERAALAYASGSDLAAAAMLTEDYGESVLYDAASGKVYIQLTEMGEDTWLETDYGVFYGLAPETAAASIGAYLLETLEGYSPFERYAAIQAQAESLEQIVGDRLFSQQESGGVLTVDAQVLYAAGTLEETDLAQLGDFVLTMTCRASGQWEVPLDSGGITEGRDDMRFTAPLRTGDEGGGSYVCTYEIRAASGEEGERIRVETRQTVSDTALRTTPPEGAAVLHEADLVSVDTELPGAASYG